MDSKKEIIIASLMAITVALGLGVASYSFFIGTPTPKTLESLLDLYTQKGGAGINATGGIFEPNDTAQLYAFLTNGGVPVNNATVTYIMKSPEDVQSTRTAFTNESGIAGGNFSFLLSQDSSILGTWHILASATIENKTVSDTLSLLCQSQSSQLTLHITRNNEENTAFLPEDNVTLNAYVTFKTLPIEAVNTTFEVSGPNNTVFLTQSLPTNGSGIVTTTFSIPLNDSVGRWHVTAQAEAYGQAVLDAQSFECTLLSPILDVYTQKGGYGPNQPSGPFALYEAVNVYAQVRDSLNKSLPYMLISFVATSPSALPIFRTAMTNASGIAAITPLLRLQNFNDTYEIHATTQFEDLTLIDATTYRIAGLLDIYTQKAGTGFSQDGGTFAPNDTVLLSALALNSANQPISDLLVSFTVTSPGGAYLAQTNQTSLYGMTTISFKLPAGTDFAGEWTVEATAPYNGAVLYDNLIFTDQ